MDDKEGHGDSIFAPQIIYKFLKRQTIVIQYLCPLKAFKPVSSKVHGLSPVWFLSSMHTGLYCTPVGLHHLYKNTPTKHLTTFFRARKNNSS